MYFSNTALHLLAIVDRIVFSDKPVKPGDVLRMDIEILETRAHPRRAVGFVKMRWDIFNQREQVASVATTPLFAKRSAT